MSDARVLWLHLGLIISGLVVLIYLALKNLKEELKEVKKIEKR